MLHPPHRIAQSVRWFSIDAGQVPPDNSGEGLSKYLYSVRLGDLRAAETLWNCPWICRSKVRIPG